MAVKATPTVVAVLNLQPVENPISTPGSTDTGPDAELSQQYYGRQSRSLQSIALLVTHFVFVSELELGQWKIHINIFHK